MKVLKFGGSSLREGEDLSHVARLIHERDEALLLVVSALNGVTDKILDVLPKAEKDEDAITPFLEATRRQHDAALNHAAPDDEKAPQELDQLFQKLERVLYGIAYTEQRTPKTRDLAVSFGERFSARLVAAALRNQGTPAVGLDADDIGIITDGTYGVATARMGPTGENLRETLEPLIEADTTPVVTGYFGRDDDGHVTTFGRGGSDYSAAVIARSLGANAVEVWKDVDGFLTADPERIHTARPLPYMTYDEAAELAYLGARVLHPRTVEPLHEGTIPILVKNTMNPQAPGTRIGPPRDEPEHLRAIGAREGFAIVRMQGSGMAYTPGVGKEVFAVLGDAGINVVNMAASQASFALLIDEEDANKAAALIQDAEIPTVEAVTVQRGFSLICFVGENIGKHEGVAGQVFSVVGDAGVNVDMISVGASEIALAFVVHDEDVEDALTALHEAFLEKAPKREVQA